MPLSEDGDEGKKVVVERKEAIREEVAEEEEEKDEVKEIEVEVERDLFHKGNYFG